MIPWIRSGLTFVTGPLRWPPVRCLASAKLPTDYGEFDIHVFKSAFSGETHVALVRGEIGNGEHVLTRVHSACLTGDLFHSARCDCGQQLRAAMRRIADEGRGVSGYLRTKKEKLGHLLSSV
jgi:3,4-dihydroxy 2-butanone 4-phosphate synthase/GTP cyclohydrolase II